MTLKPGTLLGPYEIVSQIGAGGMGVVYRAKDTRLGRDVALKVLPPTFAEDTERLRRFEQEARSTSGFNHPNILSVFDIGTHEGSPYLVMELLDGENLRERLDGKPLPVRKAVEIARAVAEGLAVAHGKGIIHRDVKPENVFLTRDGRVKVLDFGLAKQRVASLGKVQEDALTEAMGVGAQATGAGTVLGTIGYMSPEQVRGEALDGRSDVFSLGVLLWEMLTGRRPFHGASGIETMNAILKEEPPELDVALKVPPILERVLHSCLAKDPSGRFHSAHDLAFALETVSSVNAPSGSSLALPKARTRMRLLIAGCLAGAALVLLLGTLAHARQWPPFTPASQPTWRKLTFREGEIHSARLLPDGREVVVGAAWDGESCQVTRITVSNWEEKGTGLAGHPLAVSAAGEWAIALRSERMGDVLIGTLAMGPVGDSTLRETVSDVKGADIAPSGLMAVVRFVAGGYRLECPPGTLRVTGTSIGSPRFSLDGKTLAFIHAPEGGTTRVFLMDIKTGQIRPLTREIPGLSALAWNGEEVWFTVSGGGQTDLMAMKEGGRERVVFRGPGEFRVQDVGREGQVLLSQSSLRTTALAWLQGEPRVRVFDRKGSLDFYELSPDGRRLVGLATDQKGETQVALFGTAGTPPLFLGKGTWPSLSPDGRWVAIVQSGKSYLQVNPTGIGEARQVALQSIQKAHSVNWTPDGKHLLVQGYEAGKPPRIFRLDLEGGKPQPLTLEGAVLSFWDNFHLSPDGRRSVVECQGSLAVAELDGTMAGPTPIKGLETGEWVAGWGEDSRSLYVYRPGNPPLRFWKLDPATGSRQPWKICSYENAPSAVLTYALVTPDGRHVAANCTRNPGTLYLVEGLK